jgi:hypothetical protein
VYQVQLRVGIMLPTRPRLRPPRQHSSDDVIPWALLGPRRLAALAMLCDGAGAEAGAGLGGWWVGLQVQTAVATGAIADCAGTLG